MHQMVTINNTTLYTCEFLRVELKCSHPNTNKGYLCEGMELLINPVVLITSQYICASNHHYTHL